MSGARKQHTVLVVDDDEAVAEVARILLSLQGWAVTLASDGRQALELFRPGAFDIVLVDYSMPGMRGDRIVDLIREQVPDQRVVLMSGFIDFDLPEDTGFLHKPFGLAALEAALAMPAQACVAG